MICRVKPLVQKVQSCTSMLGNACGNLMRRLVSRAGRAQTVTLFKSTADLRDHAINHPVFGQLDGYEWVLAVAAHSARHTKQILEVKADPNFPAN